MSSKACIQSCFLLPQDHWFSYDCGQWEDGAWYLKVDGLGGHVLISMSRENLEKLLSTVERALRDADPQWQAMANQEVQDGQQTETATNE